MNYKLITNNRSLEEVYHLIKGESLIAVDTEFIRVNTYYPKLSLIQISYKKDTAIIIDCKSNINLDLILDIIYNENIKKIFHASRQDLEIFYYYRNKFPKNIFDTQIALLALNYKRDLSYENMVKSLFGISIDKKLSNSNWLKRPLSEDQLLYAARDVTYLYEAHNIILERLKKQDKEHWLEDSFNSLLDIKTYQKKIQKDLIQLSNTIKNEKSISIADSILKWREKVAKDLNKPRGHILTLDSIKDILQNKYSLEKLLKKLEAQIPNNFINELKNLIDNPPYSIIEIKKPLSLKKRNHQDTLIFLKLILKNKAELNNVNEALIANNEDLIAFILNKKESNVSFLKKWKYDIFGKDALDFINGEIEIKIVNEFPTLLKNGIPLSFYN